MAGEREWLVLAGRAAEFERELPFGVLVDALDDHLAGLDQRRVERVGGERLAELAAIFPALDGPAVPDGALQAERYRAHRAIQELLDGLAVGRPLLLVLDDLHWADQASLEVVASLLRRPPDGPVLLACAFRPAPAPQFLESALATAEREGRATRIDLGPLAPEDAAELLAGIPEPGVRDAVLRVSGGNPFYLSQLVRQAVTAAPGPGEPRPARHVHARASRSPCSPCSPRRSAACRPRRAACSRPPRWRASRSSPTSPRRSPRSPREAVAVALDDLLARDLVRPDRRPAPVRVPPSARAPRRLRAHGRRLAAGRPRPRRRGAAGPGRERRRAGPPRRALRAARRRGRRSRCCARRPPRARRARPPRGPLAAGRGAADARGRVAPGRRARASSVLIDLAEAQRASGRLEPCRATLEQAVALLPPGDPRRARLDRLLRHRRALARPPRGGPRAARRGAGGAGRGAHRGRGAAAARAGAALPLRARIRRRAGARGRRGRGARGRDRRAGRAGGRGAALLALTEAAAGRTDAAREQLAAAVAAIDALGGEAARRPAPDALARGLGGAPPRGLRGRAGAPRPRHRDRPLRGPRRPAGADAARPGARRCSCSAGTEEAADAHRRGDGDRARRRQPASRRLGAVGGRADRAAGGRQRARAGARRGGGAPRPRARARRCSRRPSRRGRSAPRCSRRARSSAGARRCSRRSAARTRRA